MGTMTQREKAVYTAKVSAAAVAFGLPLLVASSDAQTVAAADADASIAKSLVAKSPTAEDTSIRLFHVNIPEEALVDLRRRIAATRWPDKETVADDSQGVPLATMQELARYWATDYDWRKCEAKLNALPQFVTQIDGVDIYFIHVRSKNANAMPLILTH